MTLCYVLSPGMGSLALLGCCRSSLVRALLDRPFGHTRPFFQLRSALAFSTLKMTTPTADLCDQYYERVVKAGDVRVLAPIPTFQIYGQRRAFSGPVTTLKVFEDNSLVRAALEEQGSGKVLVVDGGGSIRCALLGGNIAEIASRNGWAGILVNGCVRDVGEINAIDIGVRALASHPLKSFKRGQGERDVAVSFGGVRILPGEWCYSDIDGILIANKELSGAKL